MSIFRLIRNFKIFYTPLFSFLFPCTWILPLIHCLFIRKHKKRILLIAQNNVAASHIKEFHKLFKDNINLSFYSTTDWYPPRDFGKNDITKIVNAKYINIFQALITYWDLIIFVNHPWGFGVWFSPLINKIYINHGLHVGKINNDKCEDGVYGKSRVIRPFSKPFYSLMFAASDYELQQAVTITPELHDRIVVTGYLQADLLMEDAKTNRNLIRNKLGIKGNDYVVHIISTWGKNSLLQLIGDELLTEAVKLKNHYSFILSIHPRYDEFNDFNVKINRKSILDKYEKLGILVNRNLNWEDYVIASDMAISDHSSLSLYHILLDHPLVYIQIPESEYVKNSTFAHLYKNSTPLLNSKDIGSIIKTNSSIHKINPSTLPLDRILQHQGQAAERYREEIYRILNL